MRFICVCRAGRVRSVTLATCLIERGHQAIALGVRHKRAIIAASAFADVVIVVDYPTGMISAVRDMMSTPVIRWSIGKDTWLKPGDPELLELARKFCDERKW